MVNGLCAKEGTGGGAGLRAGVAAAPIHEGVVLARRGRVAAGRAEA